MKSIKTKMLTGLMLLLCLTPLLAASINPEVDVTNAANLAAYLSPFIVLLATWLVRLAKPSIPGWATMFVVMALSSANTYLTNQLAAPDLSWLAQFGLGLAATFVHQLHYQLTK